MQSFQNRFSLGFAATAMLATSLLLVACGDNATSPTKETSSSSVTGSSSAQFEGLDTALLNVSYGSSPFQNLDLFLPKTPKEGKPWVAMVHGGGWFAGDKSEFRADSDTLIRYFVQKGVAVALLNYRLTCTKSALGMCQIRDTTLKNPMPVQDLQSAAAKVLNLKSDLASQPVLWVGTSAGAHLIALNAWSSKPALTGRLALLSGPTDLTDSAFLASPTNRNQGLPKTPSALEMGEWYVGQLYSEEPAVLEAFQAASPVRYVRSGLPPVLVIHGAEDDLVPVAQAERLVQKLKDSSVTVESWVVPEAGHSLRPLQSGGLRDSLFAKLWRQTGL